MESLLTKLEAQNLFKVRKTKFSEDIQPRLDTVYVGPRSPRFTRSSAERLMEAFIAESAAVAAAAPPVPVNKRKAQRSVDDVGNGERHEHHDGEQRLRDHDPT